MKPADYIGMTQVAKKLGYSRVYTRNLRVAGEFPNAISMGDRFFVPQSDIDTYLERRDKVTEMNDHRRPQLKASGQ